MKIKFCLCRDLLIDRLLDCSMKSMFTDRILDTILPVVLKGKQKRDLFFRLTNSRTALHSGFERRISPEIESRKCFRDNVGSFPSHCIKMKILHLTTLHDSILSEHCPPFRLAGKERKHYKS